MLKGFTGKSYYSKDIEIKWNFCNEVLFYDSFFRNSPLTFYTW